MNDGWIKLYRKIFNNPYYFSERFCRSMAWVDLLLLANHKPGIIYKRGIKVNVAVGQVGNGVESLAKRWRWSKGKVLRWLSELEMSGQIERQKNNVTTLITIINYKEYQSNGTANGTTNESTDESADRSADGYGTRKEKNDKNEKNNKEERKKEEEVSETAVSVAKNDFLDRVISEFSKVYEMSNGIPYVVVNRGKERTAAGKLIKEFKKVHPDYDSEQALRGMAVYFDRVININDAWIHDHMSLPTLISKFNEINNILRNGKSANNKGGTTKQLNEILSSHLTSQ